MSKFLGKIFFFYRIKKKAFATQLTPQENRRHVGRTIFFVSLACFILIVLRLTWLVATNRVHGIDIARAAKNNYTVTQNVYPERGTIYDRTGVPIAVDSSTYTIYVNLNKKTINTNGKKLYAQASEFPRLIDFLNKELAINKSYAKKQLTRKGALQVQFGPNGSNISLSKMNEITDKSLKEKLMGIGFTATLARSYPMGNFASNFIGVAQLKTPGDSSSGLMGVNGIESSLNSILSGKPGTQTVEKDQYGRAIPGDIISEKPAKNGQNVYTTLDANLQSYLEQLMDQLVPKVKAEQLSAVLMDAHNGDILATTQRPTFDPQTMKGTNQDNFTWNNLMYQLAYEPGSVMKTFLVSAAMDSGNWHPNDTYERSFNLYDTHINDWDYNENNGAYVRPSVITYAQGFAFSSNTGMSKLEMAMGYPTWEKYLNRFDFGKPTRMGIGNEAFGSLPGDNAVTRVMSSFGQGISVTELQLLRGWSAMANNGVMLEPHFINKIVNSNTNTTGSVLQGKAEIVGKPISSSTATDIRNLMVTVDTDDTYGTENYGLYKGQTPGPIFTVNGQPVSIKSGTAQIADSKNGGYMDGVNDTLNSFVIMYPTQNPDFIFYLTAKIPQNFLPWDAADVADPLIERAESIKSEIENTTLDLPNGKVTIANYKGKITGTIEDSMRRQLLQPVAIGDGNKVINQSIKSGKKVGANTRVLLLTDGEHTMPDMYGWSKTDVDRVAKWYNITVTYRGGGKNHDKGTVSTQSIDENTIVEKGKKLTVTLD